MNFDTKTLEELKRLANNLHEQIKLDPEHTELEQEQLREVEQCIELRRKNGGAAMASAA